MTSINAMRFNYYSGALVCDEQRGWNEENMSILTADKIKPVIPEEIQKRYRIAAFYGNTGTSSIGDELKFKIRKRIGEEFRRERAVQGKYPKKFRTIEEIAYLAFEEQTAMKHKHINETLRSRYGFTSEDFINGSYKKNGKKIDINDSKIIDDVYEMITWKKRSQASQPVFLNAGIIAGYEPEEGFRIFHLSLIHSFVVPVQEIFLAEGSGLDACDLVFTDFANHKIMPEQETEIDPLEGIYTMINAVNSAVKFNLGVSGYFNIIYINGREKDAAKIQKEIQDHRSYLASQIVRSSESGFISRDFALELLGDIVLQDKPFLATRQKFLSRVKDRKQLSRFLRNYKKIN